MPINRSFACLAALILCVQAASAQEKPLSAIDWLSENATEVLQQAAQPALDEPPVASSAAAPQVTVTALDDPLRKRVGLLPEDVTGLAPDLWLGSDTGAVTRLLGAAREQRLPAAQGLLLSALLAEADDPSDASSARNWLLARVDALLHVGAVEPASALLWQADPTSDPRLFAQWLEASLLMKTETPACRALLDKPVLSPGAAAQIYCVARVGDYDTAALLFGNAAAVGELSALREDLLARFLDPDLFEADPLPRAPVRPDALTFRLFEAAGAPLPTAPLPRAFSQTDLSSEAGWKAQLEAAERLARAGVMPTNQFLGLFTDRRPAASGGLWDRVSALQRLEKDVIAKDETALASSLPATWRSMQSASLETLFADLFAAQLLGLALEGTAQDIRLRMLALADIKEAFDAPGETNQALPFLASVMNNKPDSGLAKTTMENAVFAGFQNKQLPTEMLAGLPANRSGEAILLVLAQLSAAGRGNTAALTQALVDLRAIGLHDIARQVAVQSLVLLDNG